MLNSRTDMLVDVALTTDENTMLQYIFNEYGKHLSRLGQQIVMSALTQIGPYLQSWQLWMNKYTGTGLLAVPGDMFNSRLEKLEEAWKRKWRNYRHKTIIPTLTLVVLRTRMQEVCLTIADREKVSSEL